MADWELWDDRKGEIVEAGTEADVKDRYMRELYKGDIAEMDLFIEAPDGRQYAYNRNVTPPRWDEILPGPLPAPYLRGRCGLRVRARYARPGKGTSCQTTESSNHALPGVLPPPFPTGPVGVAGPGKICPHLEGETPCPRSAQCF